MVRSRGAKVNREVASTTLGRGTNFVGVMKFGRSLRIEGHFEGRIDSSGFLYISSGAEVKADISVGSVVIGGTVTGDIVATNSLELVGSGAVFGNIKTSSIRIEDGVLFEGKCDMLRDSEELDVFSGDFEKHRKSID